MPTTSTPTYPQYTNEALNEGVLDQLILVMKKHIQSEFDAGRISGTQYATVLLGGLESAMANSTQYLLGILLTQEQGAKLAAETALLDKQLDMLDKEIEKITAEIEILKLQEPLITAQIAKINAEIAYLVAQEAMMLKQAEKIDKEIAFLDAKIKTELANTETNYAPESLIGHQTRLLQAQKHGFAGDLHSKASKLHADFQSVLLSVMESEEQDALTGTAEGTAVSSEANLISGL